jgi:aspartyl-tRNA(Asn)/glutamyl-tRNA(Gln) amidotransferase subunit A
MLGKLNMDQFAMGSSNETSAFGNVPRRGAAKAATHRSSPGGSSGGSSARSRRGCARPRPGTDTGGSIRQPAAFTGISGIKPTYGRCSRWGTIAFAEQPRPGRADGARRARLRDHARGDGGVRRQGRDLAQDRRAEVGAGARRNLAGKRIGIPKEYRIDGMPMRRSRELWQRGKHWLRDAGATIVEVSLPHTKYALPAYYIIAPAEASSNLARYDGVRYGLRDLPEGAGLQDMYAATRAAGFGAEVKRRI